MKRLASLTKKRASTQGPGKSAQGLLFSVQTARDAPPSGGMESSFVDTPGSAIMKNCCARQGKKNKDVEELVSIGSALAQCVATERGQRNARNVKIA